VAFQLLADKTLFWAHTQLSQPGTVKGPYAERNKWC